MVVLILVEKFGKSGGCDEMKEKMLKKMVLKGVDFSGIGSGMGKLEGVVDCRKIEINLRVRRMLSG